MRRKVISVVAAAGFMAAGALTAVGTFAAQSTPSFGALTCAQPVDPTVRYVVNTVCSKFGP